ncbi:MAG: AMP-binding protein, partial [Evtepia sp.]
MSLYRHFCKESFDETGTLKTFELQYPDHFNFAYDVVDVMAEETPQDTALIWCNAQGDERTFTYSDIARFSNETANALKKRGVKKGDIVMVILKRHYEYWFVATALHKIGAILVPVTHMLTADDLVHRIKSAKIKAVICTPTCDVPAKVLEAQSRCDSLKILWTVQESVPGFHNLTEELQDDCWERVETRVTDPMIMYFTSGTTGYPKGVIHDHSYPLAHIITAKYWQRVIEGGLHFTVAETGWGKASWGKIYGQWLCGCAVMAFDFDSFEPKQLMSIINQYGVTTFCGPPTVYRYFVKKGMVDMPSLQYATTAGEALHTDIFLKFLEKTGLPVMEGFGQTETALILANLAGTESRPGSMGKPSPLYHVDLYDEYEKPVLLGEVGEIVLIPPKDKKQPGIFVGYYENEDLYQKAWRGGVYHTGDTAWQDEDGYFWFHGRADDVIKTGGFRVGPFELENVLMEHPAVLECAVVGIPDPLRGQAIKAYVVVNTGYEADVSLQKELREFC